MSGTIPLDIPNTVLGRLSDVTVTPEPECLQFDFRTGAAESPVIEVFRLQQSTSGELLFEGATIAGAAFDFLTGRKRRKHHARIRGLAQDTDYMFRVSASKDTVTGRARTGARSVGMVITQIWLTNDGDPGLKGAGEITFDLAVFGPDGQRGFLASYYRHWDADVYRAPFQQDRNNPHFERAGETYTIWMNACDRDEGAFYVVRTPETVPDSIEHGELWGGVWASAMTTIELPAAPGQFRVPFHAATGPMGIAFSFKGYADGTVTVGQPIVVKNGWHFPVSDFLKKKK